MHVINSVVATEMTILPMSETVIVLGKNIEKTYSWWGKSVERDEPIWNRETWISIQDDVFNSAASLEWK